MVSPEPAPTLPPALSGDRVTFGSATGALSMYVAGDGPPMLLIHSINAAGSAAEVRPLQEHYRRGRTVFALDLPGFGLSARPDIPYDPRHMTDAIHAALAEIGRTFGATPVDALALSLSSEYLARAVVEQPPRFRSVALVSPTGFKAGTERRGPAGSTRGIPWLYAALRGPGWGKWVFRQLTRPKVIRYFLRRTWGSKQIDTVLWHYDILTARQPGAECAPLRFLSGFLFSGDIHDVYEAITTPVWMSHGVRGDFTDYGNHQVVSGRHNWQKTVFETGALPFFEVPQQFFAEFDRFLHLDGQL